MGSSNTYYYSSPAGHVLTATGQHVNNTPVGPVYVTIGSVLPHHPTGQSVMGQAQSLQPGTTVSANTLGQARLLPQAFTIGTLHDPTNGAYGYSCYDGTIQTVLSLVISRIGYCLFVLYVVDIVTSLLPLQIDTTDYSPSLHQGVCYDDLGFRLNYFGVLSVIGFFRVVLFSEKKYAVVILERAGCDVVFDSDFIWSLAGSLPVSEISTRPDICYAVLQLFSSSTTDLVAYSDADWAGCPTTRRSTSGYCVFLGNNLLSSPFMRIPVVYLSCNPVQHQRTKHIEIDIHFVRDLVAAGEVRVLHVPSRYQFADIFTKGLPSALFEEFRSSLSVRSPPAPTAGEC
ncbi:ribonuclease H-like domain-containing protein [Tanacetum coccineum]|uniref:Ribonuclease H-like domain-containing protein n=1 Tax=Tanacetum coccineum TaxID=301880 RepID=A0ABQ5GZZ4_9ASTR